MASPDKIASKPDGEQKSAIPSISLPKGGGAIRGMGEKFAANPVTGTGSMSVPIATSPGRSGFGPQLSLSYDSGSGNGPFGFGWSLSLPSITRKTDKGLPRYLDSVDSDVFILSGAEDLVPVLVPDANGKWVPEDLPPRTVDGKNYRIRRYRPRIEGLFARIERWTNTADTTDVFWRSISRDNITTWYGKTAESRIADPADPSRIFSWLICQSHDDKGNVIVYGYKTENSAKVFQGSSGNILTKAHERNRTDRTRSAQRYLKRIRYGNRSPYFPVLKSDAPWPEPQDARALDGSNAWLFEAVFDYGEHDPNAPTPNDAGTWPARQDPFSSYRAAFEVRTYRICQRVLMFHHFPGTEQSGVGIDCLVRSTDFTYSDEVDPTNVRNPVYTFLRSVTQTGYRRNNGGYDKQSLPPVEFTYTEPTVQDAVEEVDSQSLENLPIGLDGSAYRWTDLHGEGIPGFLSEQAGAWFYKRNLSPIPDKRPDGSEVVKAKFAPLETVALKPNVVLSGGAEFMDLAGDGQPDLVVLDGPMPGLYEHDGDEGWQPFRPFTLRLNRDMGDPNLKFVDLDGDGHADVLISEDDVFVWHASLAEQGFGPAQCVHQALDEEKGPRLVFADGTQSVYLADLSGDGLTDIVRIRNGEVCYWPNLGYGRFGAKVTMDHAPHFDHPDQFDHKRIRLADIDGSGTTDIIYLHRDGVRLYFNQSGNSWSASQPLRVFPSVDDLVSIVPTELFGNGTACLVWSSPLPGDMRRPMRYVNLMGGRKPHLLVRTINNLGAETRVDYAPSTKFYLQDKRDGNPWITRLPFPVHVVERVSITDKWRGTTFTTTYSYHHGYFDGIEREFRGFGRVEQVDVESYGKFAAGNAASPFITQDQTLYQPPVKMVTWFHTGVAVDRGRILSLYENEYFPNWFEAADPSRTNVLGAFREKPLLEPEIEADTPLNTDEWREALRACKGMMLRQEIYELDVDALAGEHPADVPIRLFSAATHNCHIRRLQPQGPNRHAVFLVTESEAVSYHYELDLRQDQLTPDPRIAHTLSLRIDEYGNVLQSVAAVYPRLVQHQDSSLTTDQLAKIGAVQGERHLTYTESRYTDDEAGSDTYRLRMPCAVRTYELTGIIPTNGSYFDIDHLRGFRLSTRLQQEGTPVTPLAYHAQPSGTGPHRRLVEHLLTLYFKDDLSGLLAFGKHGTRGLTYETYKLALTGSLLDAVFGAAKLTSDVLAHLRDKTKSGYLHLPNTTAAEVFDDEAAADQYWTCSGTAGFEPDAAQHFYLPEKYTDPFSNVTTIAYDGKYDLFIQSSTDACGNRIEVTQFDFRVLTPREIKDPNDNYSAVAFDVLGMPVASAVMGKDRTESGDNLTNLPVDLTVNEVDAFLSATYDADVPRGWLQNATARYIYDLGEKMESGKLTYGHRPASACGILREKHVNQLQGAENQIQVAVEYSDGLGAVFVKKAQAEPAPGDTTLRWIATGKIVLNNKGKPGKQYEPYFSENEHRFDEGEAQRETGVTPVMFYDAPGRLIRTELPDGSVSRVEFSPWHVQSFDQNDTILEPGNQWYAEKTGTNATPEERRAAALAAVHSDTPALTMLDSLSREVIAIAHNRVKDTNGPLTYGGVKYRDEKYLTFTKLDAEGKPLWIRDARGNLVMQYITPPKPNNDPGDAMPANAVPRYDIAGNLLYQHSMDAGDRWMLMDAAGKPMLAWDVNDTPQGAATVREDRYYLTEYDRLHRPTAQRLSINGATGKIVERYEYQDAQLHDVQNLNGRLVRHYDPSGLVETMRRDFKGNVEEVRRTLNNAPRESVIDWQGDPAVRLENETFVQITEYDALNRMTRLYNWHRGTGSRVAVYEPEYNERGLLVSEDILVGATKTESGYDPTAATRSTAIREIRYNAKGQKTYLALGNGTLTQYDYDPKTFRLKQLRATRPADASDFPNRRSNLADPNIIQQLLYTYDSVGNITEMEDQAYKPVFFSNAIVAPKSLYEYDALYRLISATGRENSNHAGAPRQFDRLEEVSVFPVTDANTLRRYTQTYRYDSVGNIEQMRHQTLSATGGWTRNYSYASDSNRLLQTWQGNDITNATNCDYDTHGNMLNLANVAPSQHLQWDHRDMIRSIDLVGGGTAYYQYDSGKQRTRKRIVNQNGTGYWERIYLGGYELYRRYNSSGTTLVEEIESHHLFEGEQRVLLVDDVIATDKTHADGRAYQTIPIYRYQCSNHLGSACLELDHNADIICYEEYHPYGTSAYRAVRRDTEAPPKRYRYTGMERDEESGLGHHGARYYLPWLGRWGSCDPAGMIDSINLYVYSNNNSIRYNDRGGKKLENPLADIDLYGKLNEELRERYASDPAFRQRINDLAKSALARISGVNLDDLEKAASAAKKGLYIEALGWAIGINETLEQLAEKDYRYETGGASTWERVALATGDMTGFNDLLEAKSGATVFAEPLSSVERVEKAVSGTVKLANTAMVVSSAVSTARTGLKGVSASGRMDTAVAELELNPPSNKISRAGKSGFTPNELGAMKEAQARDILRVADMPEHALPQIPSATGTASFRRLDAPIIPEKSVLGQTFPLELPQVKNVQGRLSRRDLEQIVDTIREARAQGGIVGLHVDPGTKLQWNPRSPHIRSLLLEIRQAVDQGVLQVYRY